MPQSQGSFRPGNAAAGVNGSRGSAMPQSQGNSNGGWRQFGYIVSTPAMRSSVRDMPNGLVPVREAIANSTPVASFGTADNAVEIRKIR